MKNFYVHLFSFALVCSFFTQLRLEGAGVGIGDLLLVITLIISLIKYLFSRAKVKSFRFYFIFVYYLLSLSLLGMFFSKHTDFSEIDWFRQYILIGFAALYPIIVHQAFGRQFIYDVINAFAVKGTIIHFLLLLLAIAGLNQIAGIDLYYGGIRFTGLSNNPNQAAFALYLSLIILLGAYQNKTGPGKTPLMILIGMAFITGISTLSDAWLVTVVISIGMILTRENPTKKTGNQKAREAFFVIRVFSTIVIFIASLSWLLINAETIYSGGGEGMGSNQGDDRITLWKHSIEAWLYSPIFGHGPGHYSGVFRPFEGSEAHNLFFDWLAAYGLFGIVLLIALLGVIAYQLLKSKNLYGLALLFGIVLFSLFHFFARYPIFWLCIYYCYLLSYDKVVRNIPKYRPNLAHRPVRKS